MRRRLMSEQGGVKATLIQQLDTQAGDVVFASPNSEEKRFYRLDDGNDVIPSEYMPIGVVVIPSKENLYGGYEAGVMSLKYMNCDYPENGSLEQQTMCWGRSDIYTDSRSMFYTPYVGIGADAGDIYSTVIGVSDYGYYPTDDGSALQCPHDTNAYYHMIEDGRYNMPSPYLTNGNPNPSFTQIQSPSNDRNVLIEYNGKDETNSILSKRGIRDYSIWKPIYNEPNDFPAASCCDMYHTNGTKQGDWYLPSLHELIKMAYNTKKINNSLEKLSTYYIGEYLSKIVEKGAIGHRWASNEHNIGVAKFTDCFSAGWSYFSKTGADSIMAIAFTQISTLEKNYGDILISGGNVTDIPASGGSSQVTGYTYSQTYGYGDSTTNGGIITGNAEISVTSVSGDNLGTTETERTKKGESVLTVTMNGKTATKSWDVYQEANVKTLSSTSGGVVTYGSVTAGSISNGWIGAGGGTGTGYAGNGSQSWSKTAITSHYLYTSKATSSEITNQATSGTNAISPSRSSYSVSAGSKGTTKSGVTTWSASVYWYGNNGQSASGTIYVQQAANTIYNCVSTTTLSKSTMPSYTSTASASGTWTLYFDSGSTIYSDKATDYKINKVGSVSYTGTLSNGVLGISASGTGKLGVNLVYEYDGERYSSPQKVITVG